MNEVSALAVEAKAHPERIGDLWEAVRRLVALWANRYANHSETRLFDVDDLTQAGFLAVYDAVKGFDPDAGMEYTTYLHFHVQSHFAAVAGRRGAKKRPEVSALSLDMPIGDDGWQTLADAISAPGDPIADVEEQVFAEQRSAAIDDALGRIDAHFAEVVRCYYLSGETLKEIGVKIDRTPEVVRQQRDKGLRQLRRPQISRELGQYLDGHTDFYCHVGVKRFNTTRSSAVETQVLRREQVMERASAAFS